MYVHLFLASKVTFTLIMKHEQRGQQHCCCQYPSCSNMSNFACTNAKLFHDAVERVQLNNVPHVAMSCWRDAPNSVKVSIVDVNNLGAAMNEFHDKLKAEVTATPQLKHVTVEIASKEDVDSIRSRNLDYSNKDELSVCMYMHGAVIMDTSTTIFRE